MLEALLATLLGVAPAPARCTIATTLFYRDASTSRVLARSTPDSVLDGFYHRARRDFVRTPPGDPRSSRPVYGQIFDLRSASGAHADLLAGHRRIVVIWWTHGPACERFPPMPSVRLSDTELFLTKEPRPPAEWVGGLPTFDIELRDRARLYYPGIFQDSLAVRAMTASEYASLYELFPLRTSGATGTLDAFEAMLRWGNAESRRWRLAPARAALCRAASSLEYDGRATPGTVLDPERCPGMRIGR